MDTDYSPANVERQTVLFYEAPSHQLDVWLKGFQSKDEAWTTSIHLLRSPYNSAQLFAASTLKMKCRATLTMTSSERKRMIELLIKEINSNCLSDNIISILLMAIARLIISNGGIIEFLGDCAAFYSMSIDNQLDLTFNLALEAKSMPLSKSHRDYIEKQLTSSQPRVLMLLGMCLIQSNVAVNRKWHCVEASTGYGIGLATIWNHGMLEVLIHGLSTISGDMLVTSMSSFAEICSQSVVPIDQANKIYASIIDTVLHLSHQYNEALKDENESFCKAYAHLLTALGRTFLPNIMDELVHGSCDLVRMVLEITCHGPISAAEISLDLWEAMVYTTKETIPDECLDQLFVRIVTAVLERCRYPESFTEWDACFNLDQDEFDRFRRASSDLLNDACTVVGAFHVLKTIVSQLQGPIEFTWQVADLVLFACSAIASELVPDLTDNEDDNKDFNQLFSVAFFPLVLAHPISAQAALRCVECYADWLRTHPDLLHQALRSALRALDEPDLVQAASNTIKAICVAADKELAQTGPADALIHVATQFHAHPLSHDILQSTTRVILKTSSPELTSLRLVTLIAPMIKAIAIAIQQPLSQSASDQLCGSLQGLATTMECLDRLTDSLFAGGHPVLLILDDLWPIINEGANKYIQSEFRETVTNHICLCLEAAVNSVKGLIACALPRVISLVVELFKATGVPSCLLVLMAIVEHYSNGLNDFHVTVETVTEIVLSAVPDPCSQPDLAIGYLDFIYRTVLYLPSGVVDAHCLAIMLDLAVHSMKVPEKDVIRHGAAFMGQLFRQAKIILENPSKYSGLQPIIQWLDTHGGVQVCVAIIGQLLTPDNSDIIKCMNDVAYPLLTLNPDRAIMWMLAALTDMFAAQLISKEQQDEFLLDLQASGDDPAAIYRACKKLSSISKIVLE